MTSVQFYFSISVTLHASRTRRNSFRCHPLSKNINPVSKQSNLTLLHSFCFPTFIVLEQFLILMTSLYLGYQFNNYSIYASIIIAYIYHVFGHLIQTVVIRKYVPGLLTGILTSLFALCNLKMNFQLNFMVTLFLPYWLLF